MSEMESDLKEYMLSSKRNTTYLSKTSQNDLLACVKEYIQQAIVKEIKRQNEDPYFELSADEVIDVSNWEWLSVIIRYIKNFRPVEKQLENVICDDIRGRSLATSLIKTIKCYFRSHDMLFTNV